MAIDIQWANVVLLLQMEGANNSTTITDAKGHTVTVAGNAKISTAQSPLSIGSSLYLDGQDSPSTYIYLADSVDWHFPGAYSVEFWLYIVSLKSGNGSWLFQQSDGVGGFCPLRLDLTSSGLLSVYGSTANSSWLFSALNTSALSTAAWHYVEMSDDGTTFRVFVDGAVAASRASWSKTDIAQPLMIGGGYSGGDRESNVYMSGLRITNGVARHTSAYTTPISKSPRPTISGVVLDASAAPVAKVVKAFKRSTMLLAGEAVSNGSTGIYTIYPADFTEHVVVRFDTATTPLVDGGSGEVALNYDRVIPGG